MAIELELEAEVEVTDVVVVDNDEAIDDDTDDQAEFAQEVADTFAAAGILAEELPATTTEPEVVVSVAGEWKAETATTPTPTFHTDIATTDLLSQISNAELRCKKAEWIVIQKKEELKAAKDEFDGCVAELRKIAAQAANDSKRPLFDSRVTLDAKATPTHTTPIATDVAPDAGTITSDAVLPGEGDDSATPADVTPLPPSTTWKSTSIDALGLTPSLTEKLREGDIATLGELADLIERAETNSDAWPKGIGKAKRTTVTDALLNWQNDNLATDTTTIPVTLPDWEALSVEEQQACLESRRFLLLNKSCDELDALYPASHPQHGTYTQGKEDQANDDHLINCPCSPDSSGDWSFVDAWIAGWLWGDRRLDGSSEDAAG